MATKIIYFIKKVIFFVFFCLLLEKICYLCTQSKTIRENRNL